MAEDLFALKNFDVKVKPKNTLGYEQFWGSLKSKNIV